LTAASLKLYCSLGLLTFYITFAGSRADALGAEGLKFPTSFAEFFADFRFSYGETYIEVFIT
jgi:hypothetical protein